MSALGLGARSVTAVMIVVGTVAAMWWMERFRFDYWAQLSPWVTFLAGGFAVVAGTLVFAYWRLAERSVYYLRLGEKLPFGDETSLLAAAGRTLLVGHAPYVRVLDFPPRVMYALYIAIFLGVALISLDNRAIALLRDVPSRFDRSSIDYCRPPESPKQEHKQSQGCKLVERAFKLGYVKSLGSCAPVQDNTMERRQVCTRRQPDEPYLHYAWRRLDSRIDALRTIDDRPGAIDRLGDQLDHLPALFAATMHTIAMRPRSAHHLFTNLPAPQQTLREHLATLLERGCGARLAHLPHFPRMEDGPAGPSKLFEHVLDQLMFNPVYKPIVAQCEEIVVHWDAPNDACAQLAQHPREALVDLGALDSVLAVLDARRSRTELQRLDLAGAHELVPAAQVVSFQCLMFDDAAQPGPPIARTLELSGEQLEVREARVRPLRTDGVSQIHLYKQLAALMAPGFGYGRLTSNQAVGAAPEEAALAAAFQQGSFWLTKLDLLRDADLFLGNDWLAERPDLLEVYPYHLHLKNFVEIFRRQYKQHRGRL
jgi:hypothetical protein